MSSRPFQDATYDENTHERHLNEKINTFYVLYDQTMTSFHFETLPTNWPSEFLKQLFSVYKGVCPTIRGPPDA